MFIFACYLAGSAEPTASRHGHNVKMLVERSESSFSPKTSVRQPEPSQKVTVSNRGPSRGLPTPFPKRRGRHRRACGKDTGRPQPRPLLRPIHPTGHSLDDFVGPTSGSLSQAWPPARNTILRHDASWLWLSPLQIADHPLLSFQAQMASLRKQRGFLKVQGRNRRCPSQLSTSAYEAYAATRQTSPITARPATARGPQVE